jgi:4,5-DOPA dioxygenase extradiol
MQLYKQPSLFISHGTIFEAFKSDKLKADFKKMREEFIIHTPEAIVIFSGHWQTETVTVSKRLTMPQMNEGFPPEFQTDFVWPGSPDLSNKIIKLLSEGGIPAKANEDRGLDHGALIPLKLLFPNENIPVIQLSQDYSLDPKLHQKMGEILAPLCEENILFIGSGGLVHNRNEIVRFGGHNLVPDIWAKEFDEYITNELLNFSDISNSEKMIHAYAHPLFLKAHPTSEHFLPLVFASTMGKQPTKIYEAFQWKNLSMSAFMFN